MKLRVFKNKKTGQYSVTLPKKTLDFLKNKNPKFIEIKKMRFLE